MFLQFFVFRVINSLLVRCYFSPDEYWNGPEIAHNDIFGYGFRTWEWTPNYPLRSPVYISNYSLFYYILKILNIDNPLLIAYGPRVIAAFYAAVFDFYLVKLVQLKLGKNYFYTIIFVNYTNWFSLFAMPRTLVNGFETALMVMALYYQNLSKPSQQFSKYDLISRLIVSINFVARPTSILPWVAIWPIWALIYTKGVIKKIKMVFLNIIQLVISQAICILIDYKYFGQLVFTGFNFLEWNIILDGAKFYGEHPWHFVILCLIYLFMGSIVYLVMGIFVSNFQNKTEWLAALGLFLGIQCIMKHKEDRFFLPIFPFLFTFQAAGLKSLIKYKKLLFLAVFSNMIWFAYINNFDKVAALDTVDFLRNQGSELKSVTFFTGCHQTPYYTHIHKNITMNFPDCTNHFKSYKSEMQNLFYDPQPYIQNQIKKNDPSHIVILDHFLQNTQIKEFIESKYKIIYSKFHGLFVETPYTTTFNVKMLVMKKI